MGCSDAMNLCSRAFMKLSIFAGDPKGAYASTWTTGGQDIILKIQIR